MSTDEPATTPFVDWYGIWAGHGGVGRDGLSWIQDPPLGDLQLKVQPARFSEHPFLSSEHPWEVGGMIPNFVFPDDDKLKVWYQSKGDDGSGIGTRMLSRLLDELTDIDVITLFCRLRLSKYYESLGFKEFTKQVVMHRRN